MHRKLTDEERFSAFLLLLEGIIALTRQGVNPNHLRRAFILVGRLLIDADQRDLEDREIPMPPKAVEYFEGKTLPLDDWLRTMDILDEAHWLQEEPPVEEMCNAGCPFREFCPSLAHYQEKHQELSDFQRRVKDIVKQMRPGQTLEDVLRAAIENK
jgi:hypothetical protein